MFDAYPVQIVMDEADSALPAHSFGLGQHVFEGKHIQVADSELFEDVIVNFLAGQSQQECQSL